MELHLVIALSLVLVIAAGHDVMTRKIPNWLTFPVMLAAIVYNAVVGGWGGLGFALLGFLAGFGLMLGPYVMGMMGAGDVKLMAAVGAALGPAHILWAFLFSSLVGGVYALGVMALRAGLFTTSLSEVWVKMAVLGPRGLTTEEEEAKGGRALMCYGVALAGGTILYMIMNLTGFWIAPWTV